MFSRWNAFAQRISKSSFGLINKNYNEILVDEIFHLKLEDKLPNDVIKNFTTKIFQSLNTQIQILMAHISLFQKLWGIPDEKVHTSYGKRRYENLLCRYYSKKIQENHNRIRNYKKLDKTIQDIVINKVNDYYSHIWEFH